MNRREFVKRSLVSSALLITGFSAAYEVFVRENGNQTPVLTLQRQTTATASSGRSTPQIQVPSGYTYVTNVNSLSGKNSAYFKHPTQGSAILISVGGQWRAFSATCTHQPCTVSYVSTKLECPCHGATFSTTDGTVLGGPAPRRLPEFGVQVDPAGDLFVTTAAVN